MSYRMIGEFIRLAPYGGMFILAAWVGQQESFLVDGELAAVLPILPYILAAIGTVIAWNFKVSTAVLGFILISAIFWIQVHFLPYGRTNDVFGDVLYAGLSLLFPLNIWWFCWAEERGIFSRAGLIRLGILVGQLAVLLQLTIFVDGELSIFIQSLFGFELFGSHWSHWSHMSQPALLAYIVTGGAIALKFILTRSPVQIGWAGVWVATFLAFEESGSIDHVALYMGVAASMLTIAMIQISYRMAFVDELTGIPGRRALMADMKKLGSKYVIGMSDIDHFKKFNDTYGHDIGDDVLCMVAQKLATVTGGGKAYRYGGEEFVVIMPTGSIDTALPHLERLRKVIEEAEFTIRSKDRPEKAKKGSKKRGKSKDSEIVSVNISIGVAAKGKDHSDPMAVMKSADDALYRAKKKGRNQVAL